MGLGKFPSGGVSSLLDWKKKSLSFEQEEGDVPVGKGGRAPLQGGEPVPEGACLQKKAPKARGGPHPEGKMTSPKEKYF